MFELKAREICLCGTHILKTTKPSWTQFNAGLPDSCVEDNRKTSSVSQMLQLLGWESLEDRPALSRLSLFFKSINNTAAIDSFRYQTTPSKNSSAISFSRPASKKIAISTRFYQEPSQNGIFYHRTYVNLYWQFQIKSEQTSNSNLHKGGSS